jgi:hypothetical protein
VNLNVQDFSLLSSPILVMLFQPFVMGDHMRGEFIFPILMLLHTLLSAQSSSSDVDCFCIFVTGISQVP